MPLLALIFSLAVRLYDYRVAIGTLFVSLLMFDHSQINPILNGRQVLADIPVVFYLLLGYWCLMRAWRRPRRWLPLTVVVWGLALNVKAQPFPFWLISLLVPLAFSVIKRQRQLTALLLMALSGSLIMYVVWPVFWNALLIGHTLPPEPLSGMYEITGLVLSPPIHFEAVLTVLLTTLPVALGIGYAARRVLKPRTELQWNDDRFILRLMLLLVSGSWLLWFILLSNGGHRYLASPAALGAMFAAAMLSDWTGGFDVRLTLSRAAQTLRLHFHRLNVRALLALLLVMFASTLTVLNYLFVFTHPDTSVTEVADYLNTQTKPGAVIETYDSELFFSLQRPYHYPPDQTHIDLLRRYLLGPDQPINYDPLTADPDYLVVGPVSLSWHLYDPILTTGAFRLLHAYSRYLVYERVR